jgi:RNase H-fold protein (predicted Holliday junction resolvase)
VEDIVIGIDPGREKCGLAVVHRQNGIIHRDIVSTGQIVEAVNTIVAAYQVYLIVIGSGTSSRRIQTSLQAANSKLTFIVVDEYRTTDAARARYWQENPPHGLKRLMPVTMLVPPVPVDDFAAVIIAEKYLHQQQ